MKYHILVIDDNAKTLDVLKLALERAGFRVTTAESWEAVEDKVEISYRVKDPFDLIVLDLMIPERSGFEEKSRSQGFGCNQLPYEAHNA